jgi:RNA polymerase sigma factor (sigma-70 family)
MATDICPPPSLLPEGFDLWTDEQIHSIVGFKALQISRRPGFNAEDRQDLTQELMSKVNESLKFYDPQRSSLYPYVKAIVNYHTCNILRKQQARKRRASNVASLNTNIEVKDVGCVEMAQTIGNSDLDRRLRRERRLSEEDLSDLKMDLETFIARLDPQWKEFLRRLETQSITEISLDMGIARSTLGGWADQIKSLLMEAGFENYLEK